MEFKLDLQFCDFVLQSEERVQQRDPLGLLHFCLVRKQLLESLNSELVLGYLDITLSDKAAVCLEDLIKLEAATAKLGLAINRSSVGSSVTMMSVEHCFPQVVSLPETDKSSPFSWVHCSLLGNISTIF